MNCFDVDFGSTPVPATTLTRGDMDISTKHLKMIKSAVEGRISDLEIDADQLNSEDIYTELKELRNILSHIEDILLRQ